jgi:hypothetical protein
LSHRDLWWVIWIIAYNHYCWSSNMGFRVVNI